MRKSGFSMIELLLAMAIGGMLLLAAVSLLVTVSQAWANRPATRDAFDAHVNGVANFLHATLEEASLPTARGKNDAIVDLQRPVGFSDSDEPLIHFYLREAPPLFVWPKGVATRVHTYLQIDEGEGLSFLWFSELQELEKNEKGKLEPEDESDLMKTPISKFCSEVFYCYYGDEDDKEGDSKEWDIKDELEENIQTGKYRIPAFIKLVFRWPEEDLERTITLAVESISPNGLQEDPF
ncbi:prepilin-type N-terminal cleavage/methylation domain-containing protein [bacterium]|nr:prepilin-type N-terminal cleavage/methylation domain-containing protein [bacterium]